MLLLGDIGNTVTKICLINDNLKIVKRVIISSKKFKRGELNSFFFYFYFSKIKKILFFSFLFKTYK